MRPCIATARENPGRDIFVFFDEINTTTMGEYVSNSVFMCGRWRVAPSSICDGGLSFQYVCPCLCLCVVCEEDLTFTLPIVIPFHRLVQGNCVRPFHVGRAFARQH